MQWGKCRKDMNLQCSLFHAGGQASHSYLVSIGLKRILARVSWILPSHAFFGNLSCMIPNKQQIWQTDCTKRENHGTTKWAHDATCFNSTTGQLTCMPERFRSFWFQCDCAAQAILLMHLANLIEQSKAFPQLATSILTPFSWCLMTLSERSPI